MSKIRKTTVVATKVLLGYLAFEIAAAVLVSIMFSIPATKLIYPFVLYLVPAVIVVPLIFNARRFFARPKTCAILSAVAVAVFCLLITIATIRSGIALGWYSPEASKNIPVIAAFGCTVAAVTAYYRMLRRLTAKRP